MRIGVESMYFPLNTSSIFEKVSLIEVPKLFEKAKREKLNSVGMNSSGTLHDLYTISDAIKQTGVKAIIGTTFPFHIGTNHVKLAMYPRTENGKKALIKLSSKFHKNDKKSLTLQKMKDILVHMNLVIDTEEANVKSVLETIRTLSALVSKKQIYVGLHETFSQKNKEKNLELKEIMKKEKVEFVNFNKVLFLEEDEFDNFYDFMKIKGNELPEDIDNVFLTEVEVKEMYQYMIPFEESTWKFEKSSNVDWRIDQGNIKIPPFKVPEDFQIPAKFNERYAEFIANNTKEAVSSAAYLFKLVFVGVMEKYGQDKTAIERAYKELDVILTKNFSDYFLIVSDFMNYGKKNGIIFGPGRGSVCASLVAFCLNITEVEPLMYNLQFERFLNIHRTDLPDIDIDVSQKTREKLIAYIRNKHGNDFVSQIMTRSNYGFKAILREYTKKYRIPKDSLEKMMSLSPEKYDNYNEFLTESGGEAQSLVRGSKDIEEVLKRIYALKNIPQSISRHAAGVIISSVPLEDEIPMMYDEGRTMTQLSNDNKALEGMGFLKFDILGLRNLDVIDEAEKMIELHTGQKVPKQIPLNDEKTLNLFREGQLSGVFQMESTGMSRTAKEMSIASFDEIVILSAMYRPGPMDNIPLYIQQKGKPISMVVDGEELQGVECLYPILKNTNGVIVFQEQINKIVVEWAAYDLSQAELFRQAIKSKKGQFLNNERAVFVKKASEIGRNELSSNKLFDLILKFAEYGFVESHAVAYSLISYRTAYLKANHSVDYMAAVMTSVAGNPKKVAPYIEETRRLGLNILQPDINASSTTFVPLEKEIRCALQMVNGVGAKTVEVIIQVRGKSPFKNFKDFMFRVKNSPVDKGTIETLIKAGAMDSIGERHEMLIELGTVEKGKIEPYTNGEKIIEELKYCDTVFSIDATMMKKLTDRCKDKDDCIAGVLMSISTMQDKNQKEMAKIQITTFDGNTHYLVMFQQMWKKEQKGLIEGSVVMAQIENRAIKKIGTIKI